MFVFVDFDKEHLRLQAKANYKATLFGTVAKLLSVLG